MKWFFFPLPIRLPVEERVCIVSAWCINENINSISEQTEKKTMSNSIRNLPSTSSDCINNADDYSKFSQRHSSGLWQRFEFDTMKRNAGILAGGGGIGDGHARIGFRVRVKSMCEPYGTKLIDSKLAAIYRMNALRKKYPSNEVSVRICLCVAMQWTRWIRCDWLLFVCQTNMIGNIINNDIITITSLVVYLLRFRRLIRDPGFIIT